jgi:hypothetical protein
MGTVQGPAVTMRKTTTVARVTTRMRKGMTRNAADVTTKTKTMTKATEEPGPVIMTMMTRMRMTIAVADIMKTKMMTTTMSAMNMRTTKRRMNTMRTRTKKRMMIGNIAAAGIRAEDASHHRAAKTGVAEASVVGMDAVKMDANVVKAPGAKAPAGKAPARVEGRVPTGRTRVLVHRDRVRVHAAARAETAEARAADGANEAREEITAAVVAGLARHGAGSPPWIVRKCAA